MDYKAECQRIDAFELWCWRRLLRIPWTARRSNLSILKEISPEYSLEELMLKLQCSGHHVSDSGPRIQGFERICCCCSVAKLYLTLYDPMTEARQASLSFIISQSLLRFISIESMVLSNHLILCHPLLLLPSIFTIIRVFSNESALHIRWPKY